jgi:hypothetical protein
MSFSLFLQHSRRLGISDSQGVQMLSQSMAKISIIPFLTDGNASILLLELHGKWPFDVCCSYLSQFCVQQA